MTHNIYCYVQMHARIIMISGLAAINADITINLLHSLTILNTYYALIFLLRWVY